MDEKKFSALSEAQQATVIKIAKEAERQGVKPELAIAIADAETGGKFSHYGKNGVLESPAGARGLMQMMPDTVNLYNKKFNLDIDPNDEDSNIKGGVFILKDLLTQYKSPRNAVALYNASPKAVANFMKTYGTDPDAAIMSLPEETRNYSLRISKNFNLDDDKETGLIEPVKENRFQGYESEASKLRTEDEARAAEERRKPPAPKTMLERASDTANEISPVGAGVLGAAANLFAPMLTEEPKVSPRVDTGKATEANALAQDRLDLARQNLRRESVPGLDDAYRESQAQLENLKNEQRLAQERLRSLPRSAPTIEAPEISLPAQDSGRAGRASGPKVEGDSGVRNWTIAEAGQQHQMPEAVLNMVTDKTKDSPTGGKALIDKDLQNIEKIKQLGAGDYGLVTTEGGVQLQLPPTTVAERQADIARQNQANQSEIESRAEQARIQQERQSQQLEMERAYHEAEIERLRQARAQAGQQHNVLAGQVRQAAPVQRALTKAETDAEIARRRLARAQEQPGMAGRVLERAGVGSSKIGPVGRTITGGLAGMAGVMSLQEALERAKAGDTSEAVLKAIQAGSAGLSLLPPAGKRMTKAKGLGALGMVGTYGYDLGRQVFDKNLPQEPQ